LGWGEYWHAHALAHVCALTRATILGTLCIVKEDKNIKKLKFRKKKEKKVLSFSSFFSLKPILVKPNNNKLLFFQESFSFHFSRKKTRVGKRGESSIRFFPIFSSFKEDFSF